MALYASGRVTGCVLESGDRCTYCVPIYEGYIETHAVRDMPIAGHDITLYCHRKLSRQLDSEPSLKEWHTARVAKHFCAGVDLSQPGVTDGSGEQILPDGTPLCLTPDLQQAGRAMFDPSLLGLACRPVDELIYTTILAVDVSLRKDMYCNVMLSGGNTQLRGFAEHLGECLAIRAPSSYRVKVAQADEDGVPAPWRGGSLMCASPAFVSMWTSKAEYDEHGPGIVHTKCF